MAERTDSSVEAPAGGMRFRQVLGWLLFGGLLGSAMVTAFLAYGQPELLLEQLNLRYCG